MARQQGTATEKPSSTSGSALVEDGFASIKQAEGYLSISRAKLYGLMDDGSLRYAKFGKSRRIPWAALKEYAARCLVG
jgi:excisionase family DNA binding protein